MATARDIYCEFEGSAEEYTRCVFCTKAVRDTKLLLCFHPICETCLQDPVISGEGGIVCRNCTTVTLTPGTNDEYVKGSVASNLKPNHFQEIWTNFEKLFVAKPCIMCSANKKRRMGTHICLECGEDYLCKSCLPIHASLGVTKHHQPVPLSSLKNPENNRKVQARHHTMCTIHNTAMKFYCFVCQTLVCNDCHQVDHLYHKRMMMADFGDEQRRELALLRDEVDQRCHYTTWQKVEFEKLAEQSRVDEDIGVKEISERVDFLKKMLDEWGKRKTGELREFHHKARRHYETNAAYWRTAGAQLKSMSAYTNLLLQYASDRDFKSLDNVKDGIGNVLNYRRGEGSILMHRKIHFQWNELENIEAKLDKLIGTFVERKSLVEKAINVIECPTDRSIVGLALTEKRDILATGRLEGGVHVFHPDGLYKETVNFQDSIVAWDVVSCDGAMYVSDCQSRQVRRIGPDGETTLAIHLRGNRAEPTEEDRIGLSVDYQTQEMFICSARKSIVYGCAVGDDVADPLITPAVRPALVSPHYVHVTDTGETVVTNTKAHNVHVYDAHETPKEVIGDGRGDQLGQFNQALGVGTDCAGYMFVADLLNDRVQVLSPSRRFMGAIQPPPDDGDSGDFTKPHAIVVNKEGDVLVSHSRNKISVFRLLRRATEGW